MQQMAQMQQTPQMQQPKDIINMFKSEKEFMELSQHDWILKDVEIRLLQKYNCISELDVEFSDKKMQ